MRRPMVGERAAFVSAAIGVIFGALFLFAPIHGYCMSSTQVAAVTPGQTPAPTTPPVTTCGVEALWQRQPIFPMPFFAVVVWSLAPLVTYMGIRLRAQGERSTGTTIAIAGILLACTVLISFGAAPLFVPFVLLPLAITTTIALRTT